MDFLIHHMLRTSAGRLAGKEALVHGTRRLTYGEVWQQTSGLAAGLRAAGTARCDRIGIFLEPSVAQAISIFAISQAGGAFVPIHHSLFPEQVEHIIRDCGMKGLVVDRTRLRELAGILGDDSPLEFLVTIDPGELPAVPQRVCAFETLVDQVPSPPLQDVAIEKDLAAILYTSGSTGRPKGVMLSHANIMAGASIVSEYLGITEADRTLAVLPFSFDAGLNQIMTAFQQGATLVLLKFLLAKDIVHSLVDERISGLAGVPTVWSLLANSTSLRDNQLPDLKYITNTGGAMPPNVLAKLREALPATKVVLMYGLTEAFRSTYLPPEELDRHPGSIGKAIPNTEILVVNDKGLRSRPGEEGQLVHHGPTVSLGYWGQAELTDKVLRPHPFPTPGLPAEEKVCYSGDVVTQDEDGFLYFVGRRDNLIKSSGFRISPTEVEDVLYRSGKLQDAAVIGVPDEVLGQRIRAFVVGKPGADLNINDLLDYCATAMPAYMVPKSIEILDEMPKTSSGKVDYKTLRASATQSQAIATGRDQVNPAIGTTKRETCQTL